MDVRPSYWLDACEDIPCDDDLIHLDPNAIQEPLDAAMSDQNSGLSPCFFDGILDSIKNCSGFPSAALIADGQVESTCVKMEVEDPVPSRCEITTQSNGLHDSVYSNITKRANGPDAGSPNKHHVGGRPRFSGQHQHPRERHSRKRARDWEVTDRRDKNSIRRRENYSSGRRDDRDRDWREGRGYWERDRSGTNGMVFHLGSWEADRNRDVKAPYEKNHDSSEGEVKRAEEPKKKIPEEHARKYQLDVLEQAKNKNTIAFLETGAGKTLIAVLFMKSVFSDLHRQGKKMLAVFLVPKVPLVYQQAEVIRERTGYQVGHYCGEMGQDFWDARRWQREFEKKQVFVMTAQILLNILRHSIIKMDTINLLILDECHHAVKKHPYSLVMSEFYHTTPKEKRPSVFGMTASPVNLKGVSSQVDCAIKIRNLETKLDSVVCTIKDRKELEKYVPMPSEIVVEYDKAASLWSLHEQIKQMELAVEEAARSSSRRSKWQFMGARDAGAKEELRQVYGVSERTESDGAANLIQKLRAINYALGELGQWCAYKVAQSFLTALQNDERANFQLDVKFQESYLSKVVSLLQCQLSEGAVLQNNSKFFDADVELASESSYPDEIEEGELPDSHGEYTLSWSV